MVSCDGGWHWPTYSVHIMGAMVSFRGTYSFIYHGHVWWKKGFESKFKMPVPK